MGTTFTNNRQLLSQHESILHAHRDLLQSFASTTQSPTILTSMDNTTRELLDQVQSVKALLLSSEGTENGSMVGDEDQKRSNEDQNGSNEYQRKRPATTKEQHTGTDTTRATKRKRINPVDNTTEIETEDISGEVQRRLDIKERRRMKQSSYSITNGGEKRKRMDYLEGMGMPTRRKRIKEGSFVDS